MIVATTGLVILGASLLFGAYGCDRGEDKGIEEGTKAQNNNSPEDHFWDNYKRFFLNISPDGKGLIPAEQGGLALSETMGHAEFFAAEREDQEAFDSLEQGLAYFKKANGLFRWEINPNGTYPLENENLNCATETEQNIANARLLFYEKTGHNKYLDAGLELLDNLWRNATIFFQGKRIFLIADLTENKWWPFVFNDWVYQDGASIPCQPSDNGLICTDIKSMVWSSTYLSPDHVARFAKYDKAHDWQQLNKDWYDIMSLVFDTATSDPESFGTSGHGETGANPMPDYFKLFPLGQDGLEVKPYSPDYKAFEDEWANDLLRIPIYVGMDKSSSAYNFLTGFFSAPGMNVSSPEETAAALPKTEYDQGPIAVCAYGAGLNAIGKDVSAYKQIVQINENGFFSQNPYYYEETLCYYAYLLVNDKFPY